MHYHLDTDVFAAVAENALTMAHSRNSQNVPHVKQERTTDSQKRSILAARPNFKESAKTWSLRYFECTRKAKESRCRCNKCGKPKCASHLYPICSDCLWHMLCCGGKTCLCCVAGAQLSAYAQINDDQLWKIWRNKWIINKQINTPTPNSFTSIRSTLLCTHAWAQFGGVHGRRVPPAFFDGGT